MKLTRTLALAAGMVLGASQHATAQGFFPVGAPGATPYSACGGSSFVICISWTAWLSPVSAGNQTLNFRLWNNSQNAPASNTNSAITAFEIGNLARDYNPLTLVAKRWNPSTSSFQIESNNWTYTDDVNKLKIGKSNVPEFGAEDGSGAPEALGLLDGQMMQFEFTFAGAFNPADFSNAILAVHDQAGPNDAIDCSSKLWVDATKTNTVLAGSPAPEDQLGVCATPPGSTVPEPATVVLLGSGLIGILGAGHFARRRRETSEI